MATIPGKRIGITTLRRVGNYLLPIHQTRESIKSFITARITQGTNTSSEHWKKTKGLRGIYQTLYNNNFFGHRSWRNYLEKEIGYRGK